MFLLCRPMGGENGHECGTPSMRDSQDGRRTTRDKKNGIEFTFCIYEDDSSSYAC